LKPIPVDSNSIQAAAELLRQGKLVALPTETVYGLGADAANPAAVAKIFEVKGRPANHPLIVHIAYATQVQDWAREIPDSARRLAAEFWPGPLTMILPRKASVPLEVTGGQDTVALRVPGSPVAAWLLRVFGGGIAAPSANRFGRVSPTTAAHVAEELGDAVDCILDGGPCSVGVESTIIDLSASQPVLLRPGRITRSELEIVLQQPVALKSQHAVRAPGMLAVHYAPNTLAYLCASEQLPLSAQALNKTGNKLGLLLFEDNPYQEGDAQILRLPKVSDRYEQALYGALRELDNLACDVILIESPPDDENWHAVLDRLSKATAVSPA